MKSPDPISLLHTEIFSQTKNSYAIQQVISSPEKNIKSMNRSRLSVENKYSASDLPQIQLFSEGLLGTVMDSSGTVDVQVGFYWRLLTGEQAPNKALHPIEFAMLCVCAELCYGQALRDLEWKGIRGYVLSTDITEFTPEPDNGEEQGGIQGYTAILGLSCQLSLPLNFLLKYNKGEELNEQ